MSRPDLPVRGFADLRIAANGRGIFLSIWLSSPLNRVRSLSSPCSHLAVAHLENEESQQYPSHREILAQLKIIAKRIHATSNFLADGLIKAI